MPPMPSNDPLDPDVAGLFAPGGPPPAPPPPPPPAPSGFFRLRGGEAAEQGIYIGAAVEPEGDFRITSLGYERSGKTTYLGMLYFLLTAGRLPGYRFAWSDSLRELETIRAQLHRPIEQGGPTFPPRTDTDRTLFLHLGLRRWDDDGYIDLYFPEFSGEDVGRIWTDGQFPPNLRFLEAFNGYLLFLDATRSSALEAGRVLRMVSGLLELKGGLRLREPVAIVLSKWDMVADEAEGLLPEEFFQRRWGGLHDALVGQLERFRIFAVSAVGQVRTLRGHDGLPLQRDGSVVHVPAPEKVDTDDEREPLFVYRPLNLSRPLLWLLDELSREAR